MYNKQLLDEVYCDMKIINVEVRVISLAEGKDVNSYRDIDNCFIIHFNWKKPKTKSNNCFILDFKPKIINMARKKILN